MNRIRNIIAIIAAIVSLNGNTASALTAIYTELGVPNINSSFKTWMDYRTITNRYSDQYKYMQRWRWSDYEGFMRVNGEVDIGIYDNCYMIALGSYYGTEIGKKYKITTDTGNVFYGVLCDQKDDRHTNYTNQYTGNNDVVEFIVNGTWLNFDLRRMGSTNVYMLLNGGITSI